MFSLALSCPCRQRLHELIRRECLSHPNASIVGLVGRLGVDGLVVEHRFTPTQGQLLAIASHRDKHSDQHSPGSPQRHTAIAACRLALHYDKHCSLNDLAHEHQHDRYPGGHETLDVVASLAGGASLQLHSDGVDAGNFSHVCQFLATSLPIVPDGCPDQTNLFADIYCLADGSHTSRHAVVPIPNLLFIGYGLILSFVYDGGGNDDEQHDGFFNLAIAR